MEIVVVVGLGCSSVMDDCESLEINDFGVVSGKWRMLLLGD